ncbi:hypothetical protein [Mucilaginibacter antarcticus]|uniref:Uncharacterized protein n=1 Tax=Mucilaginibacter antarcticus TaxID=1855725 RepID=A0ABW5XR06_9SPHI
MRTVLIYLLSLSLLLVGGYHYANGATCGRHHLSKFITNAEKLKLSKPNTQAVVGALLTVDKSQILINIEDEEDDASFSRRLLPLAGYFVVLVFAAFTLQILSTLKKRALQVQRLSYNSPQIYILQGAMLI